MGRAGGLGLGGRHPDLRLAAACEAGVAGAWESFCGAYRGRLEGLLLARGVDRAEADALVSDLLADLALPPPRPVARTLLGTYDGSGSLFSWLAVILARRRVTGARRRATPPPEVDARGPLDHLLEGEAAEETRAALARAWSGLSERERLLLVLRYRDGAKQTDMAALLGIGAPRVSRVLDRAVARIRRALRGDGRHWEALRDALGSHLARIEAPAAPPVSARDRKGPHDP